MKVLILLFRIIKKLWALSSNSRRAVSVVKTGINLSKFSMISWKGKWAALKLSLLIHSNKIIASAKTGHASKFPALRFICLSPLATPLLSLPRCCQSLMSPSFCSFIWARSRRNQKHLGLTGSRRGWCLHLIFKILKIWNSRSRPRSKTIKIMRVKKINQFQK